MENIKKEFINLALKRNPGMTPKDMLKISIKHPNKAITRIIENPKSIITILKRLTNF